ncbi:MAG: inositol monophosphatase [Granulosicoccaceae bacterium]
MSDVDIQALAATVKTIAAEELLPRFTRVSRSHKADGSIVTEADLAAQARLAETLARQWPDYALLGEEMSSAQQASLLAGAAQGLWVLDPLDGTSNYAAGLPYFAVSLALVNAHGVQLGVVYDPLRDECFTALKGQGAWLNGARLQVRDQGVDLSQSLATVDFKRLPASLASRMAAAPPYASQRSLGSVALDWCWLAANRFHVYLHGKQRLWDYAAGHLVLTEAGGLSCTLDGEALLDLSGGPRSAVGAGSAGLFRQWCDYLQIQQR